MLRLCGQHDASMRQGISYVQILLAFCYFLTYATALSENHLAISLAGTQVDTEFINESVVEQSKPYMHKRAGTNRRSNVIYETTCSDAQITYIDSSLSEAGDMASRAVTAINELLDIMQSRQQPDSWPVASYTRRYRNLLLWGSLFGEPILRKGSGKSTVRQTISRMKYVKNSFLRLRNALDVQKNNFHVTINCNDDWLVYSHDGMIDDGFGGKVKSRIYQDTRVKDQKVFMSHTATCHERSSIRGYLWKNKYTGKEEIVYCPDALVLWNDRHIADMQSSTFESMKGKTFKDVKEYAAAGTALHETSHSENVLGDHATEDVRISYKGKPYTAYGGPLCRELAKTFDADSGLPELNADTLALFGLGVYYSQCNWANAEKPGKCWTDTPDTICPTVNNQRQCVTFDWNA